MRDNTSSLERRSVRGSKLRLNSHTDRVNEGFYATTFILSHLHTFQTGAQLPLLHS